MELVENPYLSDFTKRTLTQFDWKEGDPIPVELGDMLLKIKETIPPSTRTDVLIDIEKMSIADITQVNELLAAAKKLGERQEDVAKRQAELQKVTANMNPNVAAAVEQILGPQILDDREEAPPAPPPTTTPVVEKKEEPIVETVEPTSGVTQVQVLPFCPRCGWDMRQKYDVELTTRDKEDFVACLLGNTRFKRTFELLGGRLQVTLRALLTEETKAIYKQLIVDQQKELISSEAEWFAQMMDYRLACSVESLADKSGKLISTVPELADMPFDKTGPLDTALSALVDYVNTKVLAQEVTKRLVGSHLRQFHRLVEALEAMALEPSFWTGIE